MKGHHHANTSNGQKPDLAGKVRQILAQGFKVGAEAADVRHFRSGSWQTCALPQSQQESTVLSAIQACLQEHRGEYVRLIAIDSVNKRRVSQEIIQRPEDEPATVINSQSNGHVHASSSSNYSQVAEVHFASASPANNLGGLVNQYLSQGWKLTTEYADERRVRSSAWLTGSAIADLRSLEQFLQDHRDNYVRLIAVDPKAKRRVAERIIHQPNGKVNIGSAPSTANFSATSSYRSDVDLPAGVASMVRQLLAQGHRIGAEHADERRLRSSAWQACAPIDSHSEAEVLNAIANCINQYADEYVRLVGVDAKAKKRVMEVLIHRPGMSAPKVTATSSSSYSPPSKLSTEIVAQVRNLLAQGYRIGTEHADERRFKTSSWHSCAPIASANESEVLRALEACLAEHKGEYVRLLGIDTKNKRRIYEGIIQRP